MRPFIILQFLLPHHLLSRVAGFLANSRIPVLKNAAIRLFIRCYNVDMSEAQSPDIYSYNSFNEFFTRGLKPGCRPISGEVCSPADGAVSALGNIEGGHLLQAKGITYTLQQLLATDAVDDYINGSFISIYLAPRDYHRVHFPVTARVIDSRYIPGRLFSVNTTTTEHVNGLFTRNERLVCELGMDQPMMLVMVGAMIVAGIKPVWRSSCLHSDSGVRLGQLKALNYEQGDEFGQFELGSTVILVLKQRVNWTVEPGDVVRMGQPLVSD